MLVITRMAIDQLTVAWRSTELPCIKQCRTSSNLKLYGNRINYEYLFFTENKPITIQRKVVLMTDDRNLRVKAYTRNVPVLTVPQFRKMARL